MDLGSSSVKKRTSSAALISVNSQYEREKTVIY